MMLCACGCGKELSNQKVKRGQRFLNKKHSAKYHGQLRKGTKLGPYKNVDCDREVDYSLGTKYCKKYDNNDIKCVMCYENCQKDDGKCHKEGI